MKHEVFEMSQLYSIHRDNTPPNVKSGTKCFSGTLEECERYCELMNAKDVGYTLVSGGKVFYKIDRGESW